jgi:phospholipase D1/2
MERLDTVSAGLVPRSQLPELPVLDDTDIGGPALTQRLSQASTSAKHIATMVPGIRRPEIHEDCMTDPITSGFYHDIWHQVAENNTKLYRQVFRCMPDSEVIDWKAYERFNDYNERFMQSQGLGNSKPKAPKDAPGKSGPPGSGGSTGGETASVITEKAAEGRGRSKSLFGAVVGKLRSGSKASSDEPTHTEEMHEKAAPGSPGSGASSGPTAVPSPESQALDEKEAARQADVAAANAVASTSGGVVDEKLALQSTNQDTIASASFERKRTVQYSESVNAAPETTATQSNASANGGGLHHTASQKRRRRGTTKSSARAPPVEEVLSRDEAEEVLKLVQGSLVVWPYDWYVLPTVRMIECVVLTISTGWRRRREEGTGCTTLISLRRLRSTTECRVSRRCAYGFWSMEAVFRMFCERSLHWRQFLSKALDLDTGIAVHLWSLFVQLAIGKFINYVCSSSVHDLHRVFDVELILLSRTA